MDEVEVSDSPVWPRTSRGVDAVAERWGSALNELTRSRDLRTDLIAIDGPAAVVVPQYARYADLCILARDEPEGPPSINYTFSEQLLFVTGRPVLFVPSGESFETLGRYVLVAWNSSRPAARSAQRCVANYRTRGPDHYRHDQSVGFH